MPYRASIIIVSYNNWQTTTQDCLSSLVADDANQGVEIIVVDNNSTDETLAMLRSFESEYPNIKVILNKENRGFAGGNNDGVRHASGDIVILLNSDTVVPVGAVGKLSSMLADHPDWDMLGPVTNQAGNEQKISIEPADIETEMAEGERWTRCSNSDSFESRRLDFCCVAVKKDVYDALGGLDEAYGLGYYEDTDFSLKALSQGRKMVFTDAVFVYHKAGQSFSSHGEEQVRRLMRKNRKLLKAKFNQGFELRHIRDCNLNVLKQYAAFFQHKTENRAYMDNLIYRFNKRLAFARTLYPTNPFKKIRYHLALNSVSSKIRR